jgi:hypothetical protein
MANDRLGDYQHQSDSDFHHSDGSRLVKQEKMTVQISRLFAFANQYQIHQNPLLPRRKYHHLSMDGQILDLDHQVSPGESDQIHALQRWEQSFRNLRMVTNLACQQQQHADFHDSHYFHLVKQEKAILQTSARSA